MRIDSPLPVVVTLGTNLQPADLCIKSGFVVCWYSITNVKP